MMAMGFRNPMFVGNRGDMIRDLETGKYWLYKQISGC